MKAQVATGWGVLWHSKNALDGERKFLIGTAGHLVKPAEFGAYNVMAFNTRAEARNFADTRYGYIRKRPDLKAEPHGWRMPRAVKISISVKWS